MKPVGKNAQFSDGSLARLATLLHILIQKRGVLLFLNKIRKAVVITVVYSSIYLPKDGFFPLIIPI